MHFTKYGCHAIQESVHQSNSVGIYTILHTMYQSTPWSWHRLLFDVPSLDKWHFRVSILLPKTMQLSNQRADNSIANHNLVWNRRHWQQHTKYVTAYPKRYPKYDTCTPCAWQISIPWTNTTSRKWFSQKVESIRVSFEVSSCIPCAPDHPRVLITLVSRMDRGRYFILSTPLILKLRRILSQLFVKIIYNYSYLFGGCKFHTRRLHNQATHYIHDYNFVQGLHTLNTILHLQKQQACQARVKSQDNQQNETSLLLTYLMPPFSL